jgi:hypothetical protein
MTEVGKTTGRPAVAEAGSDDNKDNEMVDFAVNLEMEVSSSHSEKQVNSNGNHRLRNKSSLVNNSSQLLLLLHHRVPNDALFCHPDALLYHPGALLPDPDAFHVNKTKKVKTKTTDRCKTKTSADHCSESPLFESRSNIRWAARGRSI